MFLLIKYPTKRYCTTCQEGLKTRETRKYQTEILIAVLAFSIFASQIFSAASGESVQETNPSIHSVSEDASTSLIGHSIITEHKITKVEVEKLRSQLGVYAEGKNYNQIVDGHGSGLKPPTADEWDAISHSTYVIDNVSYAGTPQNVDNSKLPYFPPIGNQGSQGSCVAWSIGYYITTFQAAKDNGWDLSGANWTGGQPTVSYQNKIISPSFVYNLINNGQDSGSTWVGAINLICNIGASSWMNMPYNQSDYTSWPSQASWTEAPMYRGNSSGYQQLSVTSDSGIVNLKNLLASGNLGSIDVDSNKFSLLSSNDLWTLDNYNSPQSWHAGTVVGYDDNFSYVESGQVKYGAFKVANSWGVGFSGEKVVDGFYWVSYEAMKQRISWCAFYFDKNDYVPTLLATFNIEDNARSNCVITVGMGNPAKPIITKCFNDYISGGAQPFCVNDIVMDVTEFKNYIPNLYNQTFFLKVYDNQGIQTNGTILYFGIGSCIALGTPCPTLKNQSVFLNLIYNAYLPSELSFLPAGASTPILGTNYLDVSYYLGGQPQVAHAQNGTLSISVDDGSDITISCRSNGSSSDEEWVLNSQNTFVKLPAGSNITLYYYNLLIQPVAYVVLGTGNISPILTYYTAPLNFSSQNNPVANLMSMPNFWQQNIWVLRGTTVSVSNNILDTSPGQTLQGQWATPIDSWYITQANQTYYDIPYYHQYLVTANYSTSDGALPSYSPLLSGIKLGLKCQLSLTPQNQSIWFDENTQWSISEVLTSRSGTEQWTHSASSGSVTQALSLNPTYVHRFYLTVTSPYGSPTGEGWYNAGATATFAITTPMSGETGMQYILNSWSGSGTGSYSGSAFSSSVTMTNAITETASWTTQYYLNVSNGGYATTTGSGWYNSGSIAHAAVLSNILPGETGIQNVFSAWAGDASGSASTSNDIIMDSAKTATALWTTQYRLTFAVTPSDSGSINQQQTVIWANQGPFPISIVPNSGYAFSQWTTDSSSITFANSSALSTLAYLNGSGAITASLSLNPTAASTPTPSPTPSPPATAKPSPTSTSTQTATQSPSPTPIQTSTTPSPTPTIPEFAPLVIVPLFIIMAILAFSIKRKSRRYLAPQQLPFD